MSRKFKSAIAVVCLGLLCLGVRSALDSRDAKVRTLAKLEARAEARKEYDQQIAENTQKATAEKKVFQDQARSLTEERDREKRRRLALEVINRNVPLSAPIDEESGLRATDQAHANELLPDAPSVKLTEQQVTELAKFTAWCKECEIDRSTYIANESLLNKKIASLEKDRQDALTAVKGGTRFQRFKKAVKHVGIGIAIGVAVGVAAKH